MLAIEQYTRRLLKDFYPIIAANRPPVDLAPDPADRERFVRGSGGLVTGLSGLAQATGAVWVACVRDGFEGELDPGDGGAPRGGADPLAHASLSPLPGVAPRSTRTARPGPAAFRPNPLADAAVLEGAA